MRPITECLNLGFASLTKEEQQAVLQFYRDENNKLRIARQNETRTVFALKVQPSGVVSIYGLGMRFPVSLRPDQYKTLVAHHEEIQKFFADNAEIIAKNTAADKAAKDAIRNAKKRK